MRAWQQHCTLGEKGTQYLQKLIEYILHDPTTSYFELDTEVGMEDVFAELLQIQAALNVTFHGRHPQPSNTAFTIPQKCHQPSSRSNCGSVAPSPSENRYCGITTSPRHIIF
ncbi:hypothetical protein Pelo_18049 [Pelomyxa schiedti]|nr:hypothetical protein Pelo_18049 [Pelomyxa schiedti]